MEKMGQWGNEDKKKRRYLKRRAEKITNWNIWKDINGSQKYILKYILKNVGLRINPLIL